MSNMISVASGFQYSVNIGYDLNNDDKLKNFIRELLKKKSISAQFSLVGSEARKLKDTIRNALNKAVGGKSFSDAQDSTSCLTALLHFKDTSSADELKKSGLWQEV